MASREQIHDVAVVGAGIVGLAVAVGLARAGHRVALVERSPPQRDRGTLGFDLRTVALTPSSVAFLRALGGVEGANLEPVEAMHVWEHDGSGSLRFACDGPLAFVAENSALTTRLWGVAEDYLDVVPRASVDGLGQTPDGILLLGADIVARLVIGADGANSVVRRLAGTTLRHEPSHRGGPQRAIATVAQTARPHGNTAFQRFGRSGPVALLPLGNGADGSASESRNAVSVIWSTSEAENQRLQSMDDEPFRRALGEETERVLGDFVAVDRRLSFPVRQALAAEVNPSPRILLIGDAARTLHPLAGQGVNLGLEDARAVVAAATGTDLGAAGRWRGFARARRTRSKLMMASMRALLAAYCGPRADNPWMRLVRNAGVRLIDASAGVKAQLVREAMGFGPLAVDRVAFGVKPGASAATDGGAKSPEAA